MAIVTMEDEWELLCDLWNNNNNNNNTVKCLIQAGSQIEAGSPIQAGGLYYKFYGNNNQCINNVPH